MSLHEYQAEQHTRNSSYGGKQHQKLHRSGTSVEGVEEVINDVKQDKRQVNLCEQDCVA